MADILEKYRKAELPLPSENLVWEMYGAGLENFGKEGAPVARALPRFGPDELLLRTDAVGICFSDVKLTSQGPEHPRIQGRDLIKDPVVPGHEVSATVVGVGDNLKGRYHIGERYIVQADVFYKGQSMAYGYVLPGAMQQYGVVGPEILQGDDGSYLLPVKDETGYLQAALAEPWACVVAAYRITQRKSMKKGGHAWFYGAGGFDADSVSLDEALKIDCCPGSVLSTNISGDLQMKLIDICNNESCGYSVADKLTPQDFERISQDATGGEGFDDIVIIGTPTAAEARELGKCLAAGGLMNIIANSPIEGKVEIDVGRIHYDGINFVGTTEPNVDLGYQLSRNAELLAGGSSWFIGAAGPMGQMHVQRAVEHESAPTRILCTDIDDSRMEMLRLRVEKTAQERDIDIRFVNPTTMSPQELDTLIREFTDGAGFDDIITLVPVAALIEQAAPYLADYGVMNIFAGVPRGTKAMLPISDCYMRQVRYIGSSGSALSDLEDTLHLSEEDKLRTANSAAAIGGMCAMREGIAAVKEGRYPGKTVIFPQFPDLPLMSISDLQEKMPSVYERLKDGIFWTPEAEQEFFRVMLQQEQGSGDGDTVGAQPAKSTTNKRVLEGKAALITGAAQGLGEALAARLAAEGADVAVVDLDLEKASAAARSIQHASGSRTLGLQADVTDEAAVERAISEAAKKFGRLDIVVANAGILIAGPIEEFDVAKWRKVMDVNLVGYMVTAKAAAKAMIPNRTGVIIQINSKSGKKGSFRNSAYAASKFGGIGLTQSLALELAPHNVRVNSVCPGNLLDSPLWVDSLYEQYSKTQGLSKEEVRAKYEGQVPLGRGCSYDDVANVVVFLASEQASYMTGQAINVTGGQQMD